MVIPITSRIRIDALTACIPAVIIVLTASCQIAQAQTPAPESKPEASALNRLEEKMQDRRERKKALAQKMHKLEDKLESLRKKLIEAGKSVQQQEARLSAIETRLADLRDRRDRRETELRNDRRRLAELVLALQRIERVPPSAMIARPGSPLETAQSAMLLEASLSGVHTRAQQARARMAELEKLESNILEKKRELDKAAAQLRAKQRTMRALMAERKSVYSRTRRQHEKEAQALRKIAARAEDMKQFIDKLEQKKRKQRQKQREQARRTKQRHASETDLRPGDTYMPERGEKIRKTSKTRLPATGKIHVNYGQKDHMGAKSKGLHIRTREGALIVAPISGTVRYKGPFKNFGKLIIIKHDKNYHSLIAGLDEIDTVVGQRVKAGEPIGRMEDKNNNDSQQLYYELRHEGHPVNPARRIAEL